MISVRKHRAWINSLKRMREFMTDNEEEDSKINEFIRWNFTEILGEDTNLPESQIEEAVLE